MKKRLAELAANRSRLVKKIESQRMEVAAIAQHLQTPLALADLGLNALRSFRERSPLASEGVALLLALGREYIVGRVSEWWRSLKSDSPRLSFVMQFFSGATHAQGDERNEK